MSHKRTETVSFLSWFCPKIYKHSKSCQQVLCKRSCSRVFQCSQGAEPMSLFLSNHPLFPTSPPLSPLFFIFYSISFWQIEPTVGGQAWGQGLFTLFCFCSINVHFGRKPYSARIWLYFLGPHSVIFNSGIFPATESDEFQGPWQELCFDNFRILLVICLPQSFLCLII